jgi:hypothetical protein
MQKEKINIRYMSIVLAASFAVASWSLWTSSRINSGAAAIVSFERIQSSSQETEIENAEDFMASALSFARSVVSGDAEGEEAPLFPALEMPGNWDVIVELYFGNEKSGEGNGKGETFFSALRTASKNAFNQNPLSKEDLSSLRILIRLLKPPDQFAFIETEDGPKELVNGLAAVRVLDKSLVLKTIEEGKDFLYRMEDVSENGFHKRYYPLTDSFEEEIHTVYSASIIYTFLYIYDLEKDESILENLPRWGEFLLSMQNIDPEDERYGAFHYSYSLETGEKEPRFVVGTAALSIFTLLRMHEITGEEKYLHSAEIAGDWLLKMQRENGSMIPYSRHNGESWVRGKLESLLYNGQSLSALSKLYLSTGNRKYYEAARKIADRYAEKYETEKGYIEGEYRKKNPISNSWVVMSLMDFYKAGGSDSYKEIIFELSKIILSNQNRQTNDLEYRGGWEGAYSTSGMGWIGEVMTDLYRFCIEEGRQDCGLYKEAVIEDMRWIVQHVVSENNSHIAENFETAKGGILWNGADKYVRTDSVCHALNGFSRMYGHLEDGVLLSLPSKTVEEIILEFGKDQYFLTEP